MGFLRLGQTEILQFGNHWYFVTFHFIYPYSFCRQGEDKQGVRVLLRGHTDVVNAVVFGQIESDQRSILVSGSSDKTVRFWYPVGTEFRAAGISEGFAASVNCLAFSRERNLLVSGSADGAVIINRLNLTPDHQINTSFVQAIQTSPQLFPLTLALTSLGVAGHLLAVAGTKGIVQVYVGDADEENFRLQATLVGHENWVRSLAITNETSEPGSDLLLASASQDKYIRLWRIRRDEAASAKTSSTKRDFLSSLSNKAHRLQISQATYLLTFEALLLGHEDWIYTVCWHNKGSKLQLLSASVDNSLAFWEAEESSGIWLCNTRLGEISSQKGSTTATGSTGGFWIGLWSPDGKSVVSLGRTGSWRLWNHDRDSDRWIQGLGVSGHVGSITGIAWAKDGAFLLSTGSDQTTRLHAAWKHGDFCTWHEFARPQIHGYDLNCLDSIGTIQFISGADEKSLRVFDEPRAAADLLQRLCGIMLPADHAMPDAANIPMLGLSNKAIESLDNNDPVSNGDVGDREAPDPASIMSSKTLDLDHPPLEEHLARHTLWPEREKLYGHGYEISAVAASHDGKVVATACKASSIDHAVIRLYETAEWREIKPPLTSHSLTVTCLRFSGDDRYLLSVGRDRQWSVFERDFMNAETYTRATSNPKGHTRMIMSASWAPVNAGRIFATASRDKAAKIWKLIQGSEATCSKTMTFTSAITALDIASRIIHNKLLVAVGSESGEVTVHVVGLPGLDVERLHTLDDT